MACSNDSICRSTRTTQVFGLSHLEIIENFNKSHFINKRCFTVWRAPLDRPDRALLSVTNVMDSGPAVDSDFSDEFHKNKNFLLSAHDHSLNAGHSDPWQLVQNLCTVSKSAPIRGISVRISNFRFCQTNYWSSSGQPFERFGHSRLDLVSTAEVLLQLLRQQAERERAARVRSN